MKNITIVFAVHNHQPVGNFDNVFEESYQRAYCPFFDVLERHPGVRLSLHCSGVLWEWIEKNHPEFFERVRRLIASRQLEILGGAYYEAILSILPEEDRHGQLEKLKRYLHDHFQVTPQGVWLAERVWEQQIVCSLHDSGAGFTLVDEAHFASAGFTQEQMFGSYMTEECGKSFKIFPINKTLRYSIPFKPVEQTIDYLRNIATDDGKRLVVCADDGEKFGVWPHTYNSVYGEQWLEKFFTALEKESDWIAVRHFSDVLNAFPSVGRAYLPTASYPEMMQWALPPERFVAYEACLEYLEKNNLTDRFGSFVCGGYWRNFLAKYPEANHLHKRMLRVSGKVTEARKKNVDVHTAEDHLWKAQCNDAYWHGLFGGLYLPQLRFPMYRHLIQAEQALESRHPSAALRCEEYDIDCDGYNEIIVETPHLNAYIAPACGGSLIELDDKHSLINVLDTLARREEGYHKKISEAVLGQKRNSTEQAILKEEGLERYLRYDWYRRAALLDHFFGPGVTIDQCAASAYEEVGDFVNQPYTSTVIKKKGAILVELRREGGIWKDGKWHALRVSKMITIHEKTRSIGVEYIIDNLETHPIGIRFGVEWNINLLAGNAPDRYYTIDGQPLENPRLNSSGENTRVSSFRMCDEWSKLDIAFHSNIPCTLWRFPIETVSLSEAGFERVYQGSVVIPHWSVKLERHWGVSLKITMNDL